MKVDPELCISCGECLIYCPDDLVFLSTAMISHYLVENVIKRTKARKMSVEYGAIG